MSSYYLHDFFEKVFLRNDSRKNLCKKWYEWYEGSEYQQVIHRFVSENGTRIVRETPEIVL